MIPVPFIGGNPGPRWSIRSSTSSAGSGTTRPGTGSLLEHPEIAAYGRAVQLPAGPETAAGVMIPGIIAPGAGRGRPYMVTDAAELADFGAQNWRDGCRRRKTGA